MKFIIYYIVHRKGRIRNNFIFHLNAARNIFETEFSHIMSNSENSLDSTFKYMRVS